MPAKSECVGAGVFTAEAQRRKESAKPGGNFASWRLRG
jgi:hypothetical protein